MKTHHLLKLLPPLALALTASTQANAILIDRGDGMIYDSDQDITWLQDANYAQTSGYDDDGRMTWDEASTWAGNLNYGGFDDWRLPAAYDIDGDGCQFSYSGSDCGFNLASEASEIGYLFYQVLGNIAYFDTDGNPNQPGYGLSSTGADGVEFENFQTLMYWTGFNETDYNPASVWTFQPSNGLQRRGSKNEEWYAWAVRDGDVGKVPEPGTLALTAGGLLCLLGRRRQKA